MLRLHTRSYGESGHPLLVLLHGLFGSSANWGSVARQLQDRYRVVAADLRNHGQSPHDAQNDYPSMAADVIGLLDELGAEKVILVGHSMGGKVAMQLALDQPQRVAALAVVDMAPVSYTHDFANVLKGFAAVDPATIRNRADADRQMAIRVSAAGVRAFLLQNLVKTADGWQWRVNLDAIGAAQSQITAFPQQPVQAYFDGPVSFIHGSLSDYVLPSHRAVIRGLFPNAELCAVAEAGHWVYADQPQRFIACLESLLARVGPVAR